MPVSERGKVEEALRQLNCFPVFIDEKVLKGHYHGFCKKVLWPALHNSVNMWVWCEQVTNSFAVDNIFANRKLLDEYFNCYSMVSDAIAKAVEQVYVFPR